MITAGLEVKFSTATEPKLTQTQAKPLIDGVFKPLTEAAVKGIG